MRLELHQGIYASAEWLAAISGAHRTTVERWKHSQRLPRPVGLLLRLVHYGELELLHPAWSHWRLDRRSGAIATPAGQTVTAGEVLAIPYRRGQVHALERELRELRALAAAPPRRHFEYAGLFRGLLQRR